MERELLISRQSIQDKVKELGLRISEDYQGREPLMVGILKGSIFFMADLMREIMIPAKIDFVRAASYGSATHSSGDVRLTKDVEFSVEGRSIVLVEDIVDTGLTLDYLLRHLEARGAASVKICALVDKLERREKEITIDYCGFQVKEGFIVGYGLDYDENYRQLPEIYLLRQ